MGMYPVLCAVLLMFLDEPRPAAELKPVTVAVVDRDSGAPVTAFRYQVAYEAPDGDSPPIGDVWTAVASPAGTVEIKAPRSCRVIINLRSADFIADEPYGSKFLIRSNDTERRIVVRLRRGITVRGVVRESRTKEPIAGALVAPKVSVLARTRRDEVRQVKTDANGRYELGGVDPECGVSASHPDYGYDGDFPAPETTGPIRDIFLRRSDLRAMFRVVDADGKVLEGVTLSDRNDRRLASSGEDGKLTVLVRSLSFGSTFRKTGFITRELELDELRHDEPKPEEIVVVMQPSIVLSGRVIAPDGQPVTAFTVAAGAGELPRRWDTASVAVKDNDGRFKLELSQEGTTWLGVTTDGFAGWEGAVDVKRGGEPVEVRLVPGVTVSGRVEVSEVLRSHIKASLVPRRDKSNIGGLPAEPYAEAFRTKTANLSPDGTLRFEHVHPDRYRLILEGRGAPNTAQALDVPASGLDMGTVRLDAPTATGRIKGRIWRPKEWRPKDQGGEPWAFAKGYVDPFGVQRLSDERRSIEFRADEDGHFEVDHVPVGMATVRFRYHVFDVIESVTFSAIVVEGQTTQVGVLDPKPRGKFTLRFAIGDGSEAQYKSGTGLGAARKVDNVTIASHLFAHVDKSREASFAPRFWFELRPLSKGSLAFPQPDWIDLDGERKIVLADVGPGKYRLRVFDWLGEGRLYGGPLFDQEVDVPPGDRGEVRVPLGGGCITGKIPKPKKNYERPVEVSALANGRHTSPTRVRCDDDGNFCVRYLWPGTYSLFVHDPNSGFCRVENVEVPAGVVDVGERVLSEGATVRGTIRFVKPTRVPDSIVAVDASGVSVRRAFEVYSSFDQFAFTNLWPGHWTIQARGGEEVLAKSELEIEGSGTFEVTLTAGGMQP